LIYTFESHSLDAERRELRHGRTLVPVEPQVFDLLLFLIRNRQRVVSKDDLIAGVWKGRIVSESAVSSRITAARHAVGDTGKAQRVIRTIARKGVRFVAEVQERGGKPPVTDKGAVSAAPEPPLPQPTRAAEPTTLALPNKPSIVVLPLANLSGDANQDYFADGMAEEITIALGRLPWLFVIGSSSALTYKGRTVDIRRVRTELGVRYALTGSVRKDGSRVRVTAQLIDTSHGGQIWADAFEEELIGIFDLQDRVAAHVRTMISPTLRSEEIERARSKPTENLTAYDLFLRALAIHREDFAQNEEALRLLHRAIQLDPGYGAAYGLAAWCYDLQKMFGWVPASDPRIEEGVRLAHLAAETGRNDSEALWMAAQALFLLSGELDLALSVINRAIKLNPNSPNAWWVSGAVHNFLGEYDVALEHAARARRLSPLEPLAFIHWMPTALAHFFAGRYQDAADAADRSLGEHANYPPALRLKVATCGLLGRIEEGRNWVKRLLAVNPDATVAGLRAYYQSRLWRNPSGLETYLKGLRLCDLPEGRL